MQTFSSMRRDSTNSYYLKLFLIALALIMYQIFSGVYIFLSPLIGVFFVYLLIYFHKGGDRLEVYLAFFYLAFFELNRGFFLFSSLLFFLVFFYFIKDKIVSIFKSEVWILSIYVISGYIGIYLVNVFLAYLSGDQLYSFSTLYLFYIVVDCILVNFLFKRFS